LHELAAFFHLALTTEINWRKMAWKAWTSPITYKVQ
jgi:hypothetical protein